MKLMIQWTNLNLNINERICASILLKLAIKMVIKRKNFWKFEFSIIWYGIEMISFISSVNDTRVQSKCRKTNAWTIWFLNLIYSQKLQSLEFPGNVSKEWTSEEDKLLNFKFFCKIINLVNVHQKFGLELLCRSRDRVGSRLKLKKY